jgi:two-component system response regulator MtrA
MAEQSTSARRRARVVVVVEDDAFIGWLIQLTLEEEGYEVVWCRWAGEAVGAVRARRPQAVVLDLLLPDGRGETVLRQLKAEPGTHAVPVVVLSAVARGLGPDDALLAQAILDKPFDLGELLAAVSQAE